MDQNYSLHIIFINQIMSVNEGMIMYYEGNMYPKFKTLFMSMIKFVNYCSK